MCVLSHISRVQLSVTPCTVPAGSSVHVDSPGKNTGVGCHFLLQGIFLTQGSNPCLLHLLFWCIIHAPTEFILHNTEGQFSKHTSDHTTCNQWSIRPLLRTSKMSPLSHKVGINMLWAQNRLVVLTSEFSAFWSRSYQNDFVHFTYSKGMTKVEYYCVLELEFRYVPHQKSLKQDILSFLKAIYYEILS